MKLKLHVEREQEEQYKLLYKLASKIHRSILEIIVKNNSILILIDYYLIIY